MRTAVAVFTALGFGLALAAPVPKDEVKLKPATDEQRDEVKNNLKQIMLAFHNYESANGHIPGDVTDGEKRPLLSWRVLLLPYVEEEELYKQFKLDEAWDSKANKPLAEKVPKVFAPTRVKAKPGETFYRGFGGKGEFVGVFQPGVKTTTVGITDGTSNTIGVIDAGESVVWTKPGTDLPCDPKKELPKLGGMIDGEFSCAMCDGSVKTIKRQFNEEAMRAAISRAGGEVFDGKNVFE